MHWPLLLFGFLATTSTHGLDERRFENQDEDSSYPPLVTEIPPISGGRAGFDLVAQHSLNWTRQGKPRGPSRTLPRSLLEARQTTQCNPSNYVLVCPVTDPYPCCPPGFPVCCHTQTCCPDGTFCSGLETCCVNGAVGCGDSCCPSPLVCGTVSGAQTCVNPSSSTVAVEPSQGASTAVSGHGGGSGTGGNTTSIYPSNSTTPSSSSVSPAVIGGAVGGGVGALILVLILGWFILRKKPQRRAADPGLNTLPTPYRNGTPGMQSVTAAGAPPYPEGSTPALLHKADHAWSTARHSIHSGYPQGSMSQGTSYGNSSSPPPSGPVVGGVAMSEAGSSGIIGPGGYVPPPPEDAPLVTSLSGTSYYGGGPHTFGTPSVAPTSSVYTPSHQHAMSVAGTTHSSTPWAPSVVSSGPEQQQQQYPQARWASGVITPPPEQQQQNQQPQPPWGSTHAPSVNDSQQTPWTSGLSTQSSSPQPPLQPWVHPGLSASPSPMSPPPPPFSPGPNMFGALPPGASNTSGNGRQVPMTAPADRKAKPTVSGGGSIS